MAGVGDEDDCRMSSMLFQSLLRFDRVKECIILADNY
jgi:hypothetical protein